MRSLHLTPLICSTTRGEYLPGHGLFKRLETLGAGRRRMPVIEIFFDDDVHHAVQHGDIRPDVLPEVDIGELVQKGWLSDP